MCNLKEKEFHRSRIAWIEMPDGLHWTITELGHKEWVKASLELVEDFDKFTRGYIMLDESKKKLFLVSYKGEDFAPSEVCEDCRKLLRILCNLFKTYSHSDYDIIEAKGVVPGKIGEPWRPLNTRPLEPHKIRINKDLTIKDVMRYGNYLEFLLKFYDSSVQGDYPSEFYKYLKDELIRTGNSLHKVLNKIELDKSQVRKIISLVHL